MGLEQIGRLIDHWLNDADFRKRMREDPEATVRKSKVTLTPEEWDALKRIDWNLSDEELKTRITKGM